ncbi:MAG: undecaprenyl-diphosphate phosphatase [Nanoarchaeota archaeon]|nr:undecaprenyl-diphosphate phosphatase [Nanoarchaeota archaeon]
MLTIFKAIVLGLVQSITEWLPISSSGHLVLFQKLFRLEEQVAYDLLLHIATLIVVIVFFRKDIGNIIQSLWKFFPEYKKHKQKVPSTSLANVFVADIHRKMALFIIIGSIPIAILGLFLRDFISSMFENLLMVAIAFFLTGFILWMSQFRLYKFSSKNTKDMKQAEFKDALFIGIFQALAVFPGISRSGSTIAGGIMTGLDRNLAARFSFLLFIPAILGATLLESNKLIFAREELAAVIIGFIVTMIASYFMIKTLITLVKKRRFHYFSYYCWFIGTISMIIYFIY